MRASSSMSRGPALGLTALLTLSLTACGGATKSEDDVANAPPNGLGGASERLSEPPKPLRLKDLRREKQGSPQEAVLRLFYFAQWGSAPSIASAYDRAIRRTVGVSNIVGAYSQQRASLTMSRPRFVESTQTSKATFLSLELLRADAPPARHSFLLRRRDGGWRIVFDTLLEGGLEAYVADIRSRSPVGNPPDRKARAQGQRAAKIYRDRFASTLDR